ncbi:hypothetical protein [Pseudomonas typographi]|nr:hypothetical protein [Pseudomonas typographi]
MFNPFGLAVHEDASVDTPHLQERIVIQLAASVDAGRLRAVQRPEIDWSQLRDDEIYPFIVQHEIGHKVDNHFGFDLWAIKDPEVHDKCYRVLSFVNEILADRFAWNQIRPGEPVPLCENGKRLQEEAAESMALLDLHIPRTRRAPRALPAGQYAWVPKSMLMTNAHLAYVGPGVAAGLVERARTRRRVYRRDTRSRAFA